MKKYIKMLPIMYHPYLYIIYLAAFIALTMIVGDKAEDEKAIIMVLIVELLCVVYSVIAVVVNIKLAVDGKCSAKELSRMNLVTKTVQLPAYVLYFIFAVFVIFMDILGGGAIVIAVVVDFLTIALTGTVGLSAVISCKNEGIISKKEAIVYGILGYIYCVDIITALSLYAKAAKGTEKKVIGEEKA